MPHRIRLATVADLPQINAIYNHYVVHSTCTYQETLETMESRLTWFEGHDPTHPVTVAEAEGRVVGWGSLSPYHARSAYRFTVEDSVYVDHAWQGRGVGSRLLDDLIARARTIGHHSIVAGIDASQERSIALHTRHGFGRVAHLREVGYKFDRWLDVIYMQRHLG